MAVVDGTSMIGQYHVVAVNRGTKDGLETGHVLAIDQKGEVITDQSCKRSALSWCIGKKLDMPDERAGTLLVFKTYDNMSYGLIVMTTVPGCKRLLASCTQPLRRMFPTAGLRCMIFSMASGWASITNRQRIGS